MDLALGRVLFLSCRMREMMRIRFWLGQQVLLRPFTGGNELRGDCTNEKEETADLQASWHAGGDIGRSHCKWNRRMG